MSITTHARGGFWIAYRSDQPTNQPYGCGPTEAAAIADLEQWIESKAGEQK